MEVRCIVANAIVILCLAGLTAAVHAAKPSEIEAQVGKVTARVTEVWERDSRYEAFHKELSGKYPDTPEVGEFMTTEQWVVVRSSRSIIHPGIYMGRSKASMDVKVGDVVEMRITKAKTSSSYFGLSEITHILCKSGTPEFADCTKVNPVAWFDKDGAPLEQPR